MTAAAAATATWSRDYDEEEEEEEEKEEEEAEELVRRRLAYGYQLPWGDLASCTGYPPEARWRASPTVRYGRIPRIFQDALAIELQPRSNHRLCSASREDLLVNLPASLASLGE